MQSATCGAKCHHLYIFSYLLACCSPCRDALLSYTLWSALTTEEMESDICYAVQPQILLLCIYEGKILQENTFPSLHPEYPVVKHFMVVCVWAVCYRRVTGEKHQGERGRVVSTSELLAHHTQTPSFIHPWISVLLQEKALKVMSDPVAQICLILWCCQAWIGAELLSMTCSRLSRWGYEGTFLPLLETEPLTLAVTSLAAFWTCFKASKNSVWAKTKEEFTNFEVGTNLQLSTNGNFMVP